MKKTPLGAVVVITAMAVAIGQVISKTPPRVSVYPIGDSQATIADTTEGMRDHAFTREELKILFTHHRSGTPELQAILARGQKAHVFLTSGEKSALPLCYAIESIDSSKARVKLVQTASVQENWSKDAWVALKV